MKNLANCKPSEFLAQTFRIKKSLQDWLDVTQLMKIRKTKPEKLIKLEGLDEDERKKAIEVNKKLTREQMNKNLNEILNKMLNENAEKTLEIMALCCFIEPEDVDNYPMSDYLEALGELMSDKGVLSFFSSLIQLGQTDIGIVSKQ